MLDLYRCARPLLQILAAESAHTLTLRALEWGLVPAARGREFPSLETRLWGLDFANPIGLAAGFDKDARAVDALLARGFGFVEVGGVTPRPQTGNPKPRVFRLAEDDAVINRLGFNSDGVEAVARRLEASGSRGTPRRPVGANLGINSASTNAAADYVACLTRLAGIVDYVTINVSSPNTPGLTALQEPTVLDALLREIMAARDGLAAQQVPKVPILVKLAPDLDHAALTAIAEIASSRGVDGLIVSNTTIRRPEDLKSRHRAETGGLSGRPLFDVSTRMLAEMYRLTHGGVPLVGVGGVASGRDAYAKIRAGASLVQLYTALVYHGPGLIDRIKAELAALLEADGFSRSSDAVGADTGD